tara:strand:- start:58 stop:327 length:270 start_codon:yes stop_codon:yes gene_type:complete
MAGLTPEQVTAIRKLADKEGIIIKNTDEGRKNFDMLRKRLGFTVSKVLKNDKSANSISDKDVEKVEALKKGGVVKYNRGGSVSNFKGTY